MEKYLVTGGGGFVGFALCKELRRSGAEVVAIARSEYPKLKDLGVILIRCDISNPTPEFYQAFKDIDCVFHVAAKVDMWGEWQDFQRINIEGTRNIIEACRKSGVKKLIFTSSPSVVANGKDLCNINENQPYPNHFEAYYPHSKSIAERLVLEAHSRELSTVALRPHLIFGPGDTNLIPHILEKAKLGKLVQIGDGNNLSDFTYIDDCVSAHLCASQVLGAMPEKVGGQAYFISQGHPIKLWDFVNAVLSAHGIAPIKRNISARLAKLLANSAECLWRLFKWRSDPPLTKFLVSEMSTSHYFDITSARTKLGFSPRYTVEEGLRLTFAVHN